MKFWLATTLCAFACCSHTLASDDSEAQRFRQSWFKPGVIERNDVMCDALYEVVHEEFFSEGQFGYSYDSIQSALPELTPLFGRNIVTVVDGQKLYLNQYQQPGGCGGACAKYGITATIEPVSRSVSRESGISTPFAPYVRLFERADNSHVVFVVNENIEVFKLESPSNWEPICRTATRPVYMPTRDAIDISLSAMFKAYSQILKRGGLCGSLRTHSRWYSNVKENLQTTLYRPWSLFEEKQSYNDSPFSHDLAFLERWAHTGVSDYQSYKDFLEAFERAKFDLSGFYQNMNDWDKSFSQYVATKALEGALGAGIRFYQHTGAYPEHELDARKLILSKAPISELEKLDIKPRASDVTMRNISYIDESILSAAITYPDALRYLIRSGYDVNHRNAFGKTALMYAAQLNQLESVRILLQAGANPNLVTYKPADQCYYNLNRHEVSALHYAIRYSDEALINELLSAGAEPALAVSYQYKGSPNSPATTLEWLNHFASMISEEKNPHIDAEAFERLAVRMTPKANADISQHYDEKVKQYRQAVQERHWTSAFGALKSILAYQPDDAYALNEMTLMALKVKEPNMALDSALLLLTKNPEPEVAAKSWFNMGLYCEQERDRYAGMVNDDKPGQVCGGTYIEPFIKAFKLQTSEPRKNKLLSLAEGAAQCRKLASGNLVTVSVFRARFGTGANTIAYVVHRSNHELDDTNPLTITGNGKEATIQFKLIDSIFLGEKTLSVLAADQSSFRNLVIDGFDCSGMAHP